MADVIEELTLNGETTRVVKIDGYGSRQFKLELSEWTSMLISWRWIWTGAAADPLAPLPSVFVGLCSEGTTFHSGSGHALGLRAFNTDIRLDPFGFTDTGFYFVASPWLSENAVTSQVSTAYGQYIGRYEKAAGTQAFGLFLSKLNPTTWFSQPIVCNNIWNGVSMSHNEFLAGATIPRDVFSVRDNWIAAYDPPNSTYSVYSGGSFTKPDEASYGALDSFLLDWEIDDSNHACYMHDFHITRFT